MENPVIKEIATRGNYYFELYSEEECAKCPEKEILI